MRELIITRLTLNLPKLRFGFYPLLSARFQPFLPLLWFPEAGRDRGWVLLGSLSRKVRTPQDRMLDNAQSARKG